MPIYQSERLCFSEEVNESLKKHCTYKFQNNFPQREIAISHHLQYIISFRDSSCISDDMWELVLAHLEMHHECSKVYTGFRGACAPIRGRSCLIQQDDAKPHTYCKSLHSVFTSILLSILFFWRWGCARLLLLLWCTTCPFFLTRDPFRGDGGVSERAAGDLSQFAVQTRALPVHPQAPQRLCGSFPPTAPGRGQRHRPGRHLLYGYAHTHEWTKPHNL